MADYRVVGAHEINKWLWFMLKDFEYKPGVKAFKDYKDSGNFCRVFDCTFDSWLPMATNERYHEEQEPVYRLQLHHVILLI